MSVPGIDEQAVRRRQRGRAMVTALILGALVALFFAITIVKMKHQ